MSESITNATGSDCTITLSNDKRQRCEVRARVMDCHRPPSLFDRGKKGEHDDCRFFDETHAAPG